MKQSKCLDKYKSPLQWLLCLLQFFHYFGHKKPMKIIPSTLFWQALFITDDTFWWAVTSQNKDILQLLYFRLQVPDKFYTVDSDSTINFFFYQNTWLASTICKLCNYDKEARSAPSWNRFKWTRDDQSRTGIFTLLLTASWRDKQTNEWSFPCKLYNCSGGQTETALTMNKLVGQSLAHAFRPPSSTSSKRVLGRTQL